MPAWYDEVAITSCGPAGCSLADARSSVHSEGVSRSLSPLSSARAYAGTNVLAEFTCIQLRYTPVVGQRALGKPFKLATLARSTGTTITPARHTGWQQVPAVAADANRRSGMVVWELKPTEFGGLLKGSLALEAWPLSILTALPLKFDCGGVGRICVCIGRIIALVAVAVYRLHRITSFREEVLATAACRNLQQARNCMLREILAGIAARFITVADKPPARPHSRQLLAFHPEKLRSNVNPKTAIASRWNRTRDGSNWGNGWPFGIRLMRQQEYLRLLRLPLCVPSAAGAPVTAVGTVWRS